MSAIEWPRGRARKDAPPARRMATRHLDLDGALARLAVAAEQSQIVLFAEASVVLKELLAADGVRILVHSGGTWRDWERLETSEEDRAEPVPAAAAAWDTITAIGDDVFVPVRAGSIALVVETPRDHAALEAAATLLRMALAACAGTHGHPDKLDAIRVFQRVAGRILKSKDLQEVLLLITHEAKNRLAADISGVLLLEGDELVMQRCAGNLSADTSALRMRQGQGVAGRVLQTREPCGVEDYLRSDVISRDFFGLARSERVRSALAAPIVVQDAVIGVLEVWRRRPSTFTCQHTAELVTLANLAAIAIENVRLTAAREEMVRELAETNRALRVRYDAIQRSASLQEGLARTLLDGEELPGIATQASETLGAPILLLDAQTNIAATSPGLTCDEAGRKRIRSLLRRESAHATRLSTERDGDRFIAFQPIMAGTDHFGWVVALCDEEPDEALHLALAQVCTMSALCNVKQRAAARARSDKLEAVLWDLLDGPDNVRRLAAERAKDLDIALAGQFVVVCARIDALQADGASAAEIERRRRLVAEAPMRADAAAVVRLSGLRDDALCLVCEVRTGDAAVKFAAALCETLVEQLPQSSVHIGVGTPTSDPMALGATHREARIASAVARQRGRTGVIAYDAVGIAGLLMGARGDEDFRHFVAATLGPILQEKASHRDILVTTLRVFFAENCCRNSAAERLRIHQKTISYRLDKISRLTGLDLTRHDDRVLADLALRMQSIVT